MMNGSLFSTENFLLFKMRGADRQGAYPVRNDLISVGFSQTDQVHLISVEEKKNKKQFENFMKNIYITVCMPSPLNASI